MVGSTFRYQPVMENGELSIPNIYLHTLYCKTNNPHTAIMMLTFRHISKQIITRSFVSTNFVCKNIVQTVPALGESITEGSIAKWLKNSGDHVDVDEVVCIVETDKVTVDIKSEFGGKFLKRIAEETVATCFRAEA